MRKALEVFKARHQFAQEIFYDHLWEEYTEAQLRQSVHPSMNSLAWILWHVARVEDAGVNRFVAHKPQVYHEGDWMKTLGITAEHFGYGMPETEMRELSETIKLDALRGYWNAVISNTFSVLDELTPERLDETLSLEEVAQVMIMEKVSTKQAGTNVPYAGWTRLEALFHFSMTHYYWHGGEVRTIEGLMKTAT